MRILSKIKKVLSFARCPICKEVFKDDLLIVGSIGCPNGCGCALERGIKK